MFVHDAGYTKLQEHSGGKTRGGALQQRRHGRRNQPISLTFSVRLALFGESIFNEILGFWVSDF